MPKHVQAGLILVLENATKYAYSTNANAFPDSTRNDLFATTMNASMGHVRLSSKFEYVHIVLSTFAAANNTAAIRKVNVCFTGTRYRSFTVLNSGARGASGEATVG